MPDIATGTLNGVLPALARIAGRPGADAPDRRTAHGLAVCRSPHVEAITQARRPGRGSATYLDSDEAYGHPCAVSQAQHQPNTSKKHPAHKVYPYLLRNLPITRSNHVWAADITYIPMKRGFVYLFAVLDWASRRVLSWRVSNTLTTDFCIEAVQEAINRYGKPDIFNTDQGCLACLRQRE
jgi:transposase InsO family protein